MQPVTLDNLEHLYITTCKVHRKACLEVKKIISKITNILTALESARPRCRSGLQVLCSLHDCVDRCKLLLRHCSESSKLYLAISGERIILRCERIRNSLESCLSQLQCMVEPTLAAQISKIVDYLKTVAFTLDSSEDEAGRVLLALLHQDIAASKIANVEEVKAFKFAALRLHIISPLALVIEKRSIRKLISKISTTDPVKKKILNYMLYLVKKYGNSMKEQEVEGADDKNNYVFDSLQRPVQFKNRHLSLLSSSSSVPSYNTSLGDLNLQVDNVSIISSDAGIEDGSGEIQENSMGSKCHPITYTGPNLFILGNLSVLPWLSRRKAVEEIKNQLKDEQESHVFIPTSYIKPMFKFLKEAHRLGDSGAKRNGAELLLMFLKECRNGVPPLPKDAMHDLALFLDSEITEEALLILEMLSCHQHYSSEVVSSGILSFLHKLIKNPDSKHHSVVLRILCNLSAHANLGHHLIYLGFIEDLVPFLDELLQSGYCVKIFRNLCTIDEAAAHFIENERCIISIGELLEVVNDEEQENTLDILLSLCYQREEASEILMQDCIVSSLVEISTNGSCKGKLMSVELLQLLTNAPEDLSQVFSLTTDTSQSQSTNGKPKTKNSGFKSLRLFGRIKAKIIKSLW